MMNTGRIQDKLRDSARLKDWWDQYALEAADKIDELEKRLTVCRMETARSRAMFEMAIMQLVKIKSFVHPDGIIVNGLGYSFHPPDALVREAWEALSKAIREIDVEKLARDEP